MTTIEPNDVDRFDEATAIERVDEHVYEAMLDEGYTVMGRPNGGYLLAVAARAATTDVEARGVHHPHCLAASASFVRAASVGPARVDVAVQRSGTRISNARATVSQGGRVVMEALLSCGRLQEDTAIRHDTHVAPTLPPVDACPRSPAGGPPGEGITILDRVELRLDPATTGFVRGEVHDEAEIRGWLRMAGGRRADDLALLFAADALPPATAQIGSTGWVPTIQLSVFVRGLPAPGWLAARQSARFVSAGLMDETCELWDASGRLVVQAVQLAMVRFPSGKHAP